MPKFYFFIVLVYWVFFSTTCIIALAQFPKYSNMQSLFNFFYRKQEQYSSRSGLLLLISCSSPPAHPNVPIPLLWHCFTQLIAEYSSKIEDSEGIMALSSENFTSYGFISGSVLLKIGPRNLNVTILICNS